MNNLLISKILRDKLAYVLLLVLVGLTVSACSDDDDDDDAGDPGRVVGTWYGTRSYYNPVSGTKYQYLTMTFEANGTGRLEYESPVSYAAAYFTYRVSGDKVVCDGAKASTNDEDAEAFNMILQCQGDRLVPQNVYTNFILTRDGSVETDGNGNEVVDQGYLLNRVWVKTDGTAVVNIKSDDELVEYELVSPFSSSYSSVTTTEYYYDSQRRLIQIGTDQYEIITLDNNSLQLKSTYNGKMHSYKGGTSNDIPKYVDVKKFLSSSFFWMTKDEVNTFAFNERGEVTYFEESGVRVGSIGYATLSATGTFTVSGNKIVCNFTRVYWEGGNYSDYKNLFPGWTYEKGCTKTYTYEITSDNNLTITTPEGKNLYLYD